LEETERVIPTRFLLHVLEMVTLYALIVWVPDGHDPADACTMLTDEAPQVADEGGAEVGAEVALAVGALVGAAVGAEVALAVGALVGAEVGLTVLTGALVGAEVGAVGAEVALAVGALVGALVGADVAAAVPAGTKEMSSTQMNPAVEATLA
jgi:uncharacterized protein YcfJ